MINKDLLYDLYVNRKFSTEDVASRLGLGTTTIRRYLKRLNIPIRSRSEAAKVGWVDRERIIPTKEELYDLYIVQRFSATRISQILGICVHAVLGHLRNYGFQIRDYSEANKNKKFHNPMHQKLQFREYDQSLYKKLHDLKDYKRIHNDVLIKECRKLEEQGLRVIPMVGTIPDAVVIDFDQRKVMALELTTHDYRYKEYNEKYSDNKYYDDLIWIIYRLE